MRHRSRSTQFKVEGLHTYKIEHIYTTHDREKALWNLGLILKGLTKSKVYQKHDLYLTTNNITAPSQSEANSARTP